MATVAHGHTGFVTMPTNHSAHLRDWNATISRVSSDLTGFEDDARRRRLGVQDIQGSARGFPHYGEADTEPGIDEDEPGGSITLGIDTGVSIQAVVVISGIPFNVVKDGDSTIEFNFENSDGNEVVQTWATA